MDETMPATGVRLDSDATDQSELVVRNARIYTGDPSIPTASAVAVRAGRIAVVGCEKDVAPEIGRSTRVIDALGHRVIPGLNDSHLHVIRGGLHYLLELRWDGVPSLGLALAMLRDQAARTPAGQWVRVVGGWTGDQFVERRPPTIMELNAAAPDTPVFVLHLYQSAILNRAAVEAVGLTKDTPDPPGGQIVRGHNGTPTGLLLAAPAATLLYRTLAAGPVLGPGEQRESTRHFLRELNRFGLTSAIDAGGGYQSFPENYGSIVDLAASGELSLRIGYHLFPQVPGQELDDLTRFTTEVDPFGGDEWLRVNGAGENLVWSFADYENFGEPRPELADSAAGQLEAAIRLLFDRGWGFRLHATYGETIKTGLDILDKVEADQGIPRGVRWIFDHAETIDTEDLDRIGALGGAVSVQNRMMFQGQAFIQRHGKGRAATAPPLGALTNCGLLVAAGTDGTRVSSYNPWMSLEWLVTGRDIAGRQISAPENRLDRETALRMYTAAGAALTGEGELKGQLKVGQLADLAVLSDDYFDVPDGDISRIESLLTVVGGRTVYSAGPFEGLAEPAPVITPGWSPVAHFGGAFPTRQCDGLCQARAVTDMVAASEELFHWRTARSPELQHARAPITADPCLHL